MTRNRGERRASAQAPTSAEECLESFLDDYVTANGCQTPQDELLRTLSDSGALQEGCVLRWPFALELAGRSASKRVGCKRRRAGARAVLLEGGAAVTVLCIICGGGAAGGGLVDPTPPPLN